MNRNAARLIAWQRVWEGLQDLSRAPELQHPDAVGARDFVLGLADICDDIGQHVEEGTLGEAMQKLDAGFRRAKKRDQDAPAHSRREEAREMWLLEQLKPPAARRSKKAVMLDLAAKMQVSYRTVERWLSGP